MHCGNRLKPERFLDKPRFFEGRLAAAMQLNDKTLGVFEKPRRIMLGLSQLALEHNVRTRQRP